MRPGRPRFVNARPAPPTRPSLVGKGPGLPPPRADDDRRYVWESRFGTIVIEVIGGSTFVNGERVEPAAA